MGFSACLCRSFSPTLGIGLLHLLAGQDLLVFREQALTFNFKYQHTTIFANLPS